MPPVITLTDKPEPAVATAMVDLLLAFNNAASGWRYDHRMLVISVADPANQQVLGGLWGSTSYGYLHVDMLYLPELLRGQGLGSRLMRMAEEEARRRGSRGCYLESFDFQARGFFEKLGYQVFGTLEEHPPGHSRFFLKKLFS